MLENELLWDPERLGLCDDAEMVAGDFAPGTTQVYKKGWSHWITWCMLRGEPVFP